MKHAVWAALSAAAMISSAGQAAAAVQTLNVSVDLRHAWHAMTTGENVLFWPDAFGNLGLSYAAGDTFDITIDFLDDQHLTFDSIRSLTFFLFDPAPIATAKTYNATNQIAFLGADGASTFDVGPGPQIAFGGKGTVFLIAETSQLGGAPQEMYGLHFLFTPEFASPVAGTFASAQLNIEARNIGGAPFGGGLIPEPASWALMILGLGGLGAALRGQRRFRPANLA